VQGQGVLGAVPELEEVSLAMPNIHHLPYDVSRFGVKHTGDVLLPTEEPQGTITATLQRTAKPRL
jgi:urate oxidase